MLMRGHVRCSPPTDDFARLVDFEADIARHAGNKMLPPLFIVNLMILGANELSRGTNLLFLCETIGQDS